MTELWNEFLSLLENLNQISPDTRDIFAVIGAVSSAITILFAALATLVTALGTALVGLMGVLGVAGTVVLAILLLLLLLAIHFFCAFPTFVLARKKKSKLAWLAWLPIPYLLSFVQCDIPGKEPLKIFGHTLALKYRHIGCGIATVLSLFGTTIFNVILNIILCAAFNVIPGIGQFIGIVIAIVSFVPVALVIYYNFLSLRDILDCFREDDRRNLKTALVFTLVDDLVLQVPLLRTLALYRMLLRKPLPIDDPLVVEGEEQEESSAADTAALEM